MRSPPRRAAAPDPSRRRHLQRLDADRGHRGAVRRRVAVPDRGYRRLGALRRSRAQRGRLRQHRGDSAGRVAGQGDLRRATAVGVPRAVGAARRGDPASIRSGQPARWGWPSRSSACWPSSGRPTADFGTRLTKMRSLSRGSGAAPLPVRSPSGRHTSAPRLVTSNGVGKPWAASMRGSVVVSRGRPACVRSRAVRRGVG